jgi:hypothetical protein
MKEANAAESRALMLLEPAGRHTVGIKSREQPHSLCTGRPMSNRDSRLQQLNSSDMLLFQTGHFQFHVYVSPSSIACPGIKQWQFG